MEAPAAGTEEKEGPQIREGLKRLLARPLKVCLISKFCGVAKAMP